MTSTDTMWIDGQFDKPDVIGDAGFLISHTNNNHGGATHYVLRDTPAHTNMSREPRLTGWCGETNNISTNACGAWKIVRVAKNGRILIQQIVDEAELAAFLEEHGYPDLA